MLFIEQPVGVGFSYFNGKAPDYGDPQAARDNYLFLKGFLAKFPHFGSNDLYVFFFLSVFLYACFLLL